MSMSLTNICEVRCYDAVAGYHYRVTLDLAKPAKAESWVQGFMKVTMHSDNNIIRNLDLTPGYATN